MPEIVIGSRNQKSPFFDATMRAGASAFTVYNGMYLPASYGDTAEEYRRLTERVALWDVSSERQLEISGPDAFALTNYLSARDLTGMKVGRARYAPLCDHQGRMINDPVVLRIDENRYWLSLADSNIWLWARAIAGERDDDVRIFEAAASPLAIQGPLADDLARDLFGAEMVDGLGFFHHCPTETDRIPLVLCRSGWSKQGGFELFLTDESQGERLWDVVMAAGEQYGIGPGAPNHQERMESGLLSFGSDHDRDTDPIEAGLGAYTSLSSDHQFLGRAALEARLARPVRRNLVNVRLAGDSVPCMNPWPASIDGESIGMLHNAMWSPRLDAWIGLAQLTTPHDAPGTTFDVAIPDGSQTTARVHDEPFGAIQTF